MYPNNELPYNYYPEATAAKARQIIRESGQAIVETFYRRLLKNPKTAEFLTHNEVERRLKGSMIGWLEYTFDYSRIRSDPEGFREYQFNVGCVHSRVNIGLYVLNYAKVVLKRGIFEIDDAATLFDPGTLRYISDVVDYAVDMFNEAYLTEIIETTRHQQALRIITSSHQLALDLERAKGEVTAWIKDTMWRVSQNQTLGKKKVNDLNIYHWLKHKGSFSFSDQSTTGALLEKCDELRIVETAIDQALQDEASSNQLLATAMAASDRICELLDQVIEGVLRAEQNIDALTRTLSRRYLLAIAQREVLFARQTGNPFCVLMIDIDDFKKVNDEHGHRFGDQALEQVAGVLMERVRPGDYVFRYGGEEFLVLISETDAEAGAMIAEDIRRRIYALEIAISDSNNISLSVSIGVGEYDFHPDFMRTLDIADRRLYLAKDAGKNRVQARG